MYNIKSYDQLMINNFNRIKTGLYFDDNYQPYSKDFLNEMIEYFLSKENYESCQILKELIDRRFNHDNGYNTLI